MWTKEQTKLSMAADLVRAVMKIVGDERNVCLCCDSWYPKGEVLELVNKFQNLTLICSVVSFAVSGQCFLIFEAVQSTASSLSSLGPSA